MNETDKVNEPTALFHYTSMDTLLSMLNKYRENMSIENLIFWASSIFTMNDPKEMEYGKEVLNTIIPEIEALFNIPKDDRLNIDSLDSNKILSNNLYTPYVISFTSKRDDLAMWTMYGDKGCGVVLKLNKNTQVYPTSGIGNPKLVNVYYQKGIDRYQEFIQIYNEGLTEWSTLKDDKNVKECKEKTLSKIYTHLCPYIKSESYKKEKESRFCFFDIPLHLVKFRCRNKNLIPYVEIPIPIAFFEEVIIGPCNNIKTSYQNLRYLYRQ